MAAPIKLTKEEAEAAGLFDAPIKITSAEAEAQGLLTRPKRGKAETALLHGGSGALSGFLDEAGGAIASGMDKAGLWDTGEVPVAQDKTGKPLPNQPQRESVYDEVRDGIRQDLKETQEDHGALATTSEVGGATLAALATKGLSRLGTAGKVASNVVSPGSTLAAKGIAGAAKVAGLQGAVAGFGNAQGGAGEQILNTAIGFGTGGIFGAGGALLTKGFQRGRDAYRVWKAGRQSAAESAERVAEGMAPLPSKTADQVLDEAHEASTKQVKEELAQKVLNEVAEGNSGKLTTPTNAKHLDRASDAIVDEVTIQPDSKAVRGAVLDRAKSGRETLKKIIGKVKQRNDDNYALFKSAGKHVIDEETYSKGIQDEIQKRIDSGHTEDAEMLEVVKDSFERMWAKTTGGKVTLEQLRQWTTDAQNKAASAIGGLHPHDLARRRARIAGIVTEDMGDALRNAAGDDKTLTAAAERIAANNRRLHGLLTADAALAARQWKEQTGRPTSQRVAEALAGGGIAATAGALLGNDEDRAMTAGGMALIGLGGGLGGRRFIGSVGRFVQRGETTAAIEAAKEAAAVGRRATQDAVASRVGVAAARSAATPDLGPLTDSQLMQELRRAAENKDSERSQSIIAEIGRRKRN